MAISLDEANKMVAGAIAKAEELNIKINVAVVDAGGRLLAFNRMDGAIWGGMYGSQGKAVASAAFGRSSADLQERADSPIIKGILVIEGSQLRRVSRIAEFDETNAFHDPSGVDIQARDYTFGQHSGLVSPLVLRSSLKYNTVPRRA